MIGWGNGEAFRTTDYEERRYDRMHPAIKHTLKFRLSLIITGLIAMVTLAGGAYIVRKASEDTRAEVISALNLADHFIDAEAAILQENWLVRGFSPPMFHLQELVDVRHLSVTLLDREGRVLDSNVDHDHPPALAPDWFSWMVRNTSSPMSSQIRLITFDGKPVGRLVIAPDPTYEVDEIWTTSKNLLGLLGLLFVLLNALVWLAVSRAMRPIERILEALGEIGSGNLAARLPSFGTPEMGRISVGFNHMAETLEHSIAENQRLTRRMLEIQEQERKSLARDLHDEIGQCMSAIHADAVVIRNRGGTEVRESAEAIVAITSRIKNMIRSMLLRLRPPVLEGLGLEAAVRELTAAFQQRNPQIACTLQTCPEIATLEGEVAIAIYRVIQECLTNVVVHASAHRVSIEMTQTSAPTQAASRIMLTITDDGVGFFVVSPRQGYGLTGMRERVQVLGGRWNIDSNPGRGTRVCVEVPLPAAALDSAA